MTPSSLEAAFLVALAIFVSLLLTLFHFRSSVVAKWKSRGLEIDSGKRER